MLKSIQAGAVVVLLLVSQLASAVSPFDPLVTAVSFTDVIAALFAVAAVIAAVLVTIRGVKWVMHMIAR
jgi:hypothetical protein